jgi:hypothetical protein
LRIGVGLGGDLGGGPFAVSGGRKWQTGPVTEHVRPAVPADVDAMTEMAGARREQYAGYQPVFWRPASNAEQLHRPYLARLVDDQDVITLVSEDSGLFTGFLIALLGDAPGVYDPGGRTCQIDDFAVTPDRWATAGPLLLRSAIEQAAQRGAVQAVVVTGHLDQPKRDALRSCGLSVASEWWVSSWPRKSLLARLVSFVSFDRAR